MSESKPDACLRKLDELIHFATNVYSESDTRAKLIDPMFKNCLGWKEDDITRETHVYKGFLDYLFSTDGARRFVLEAKEIGESFKIPKSLSERRYKIAGTISTDGRIRDAIEQAQRYCIEVGVKYAIVSNGYQYIIFEAFRHGSNWREGRCIVFNSLEDVKQHFVDFWNALSRDSVVSGSLHKYVSKEEALLEFQVPIAKLHATDVPLPRNDLSILLEPFNSQIFGDLTDESQLEALGRCYVTERQYQDADRFIGRQFDIPPLFAQKYHVDAITESGADTGTFQRNYERFESFLRAAVPRGQLVLLMGGVGCGKTTFVHHFFNFVIRNPERTVWFYVDFSKSPPDPDGIENYVYTSIVNDFQRRYAHRLREISDQLSKIGLHFVNPDIRDLIVLVSSLANAGLTVSIVLDNVDQHSHVSPKFQERALLVARSLAESLRTITILTLREESFFRSTRSGVLDAMVLATFHLSSPPFQDLVRQRINYALEILALSDENIRTKMRTTVDLGPEKARMEMVFGIVRNSLRHSRWMGREILRFIEEMSGGDMRTALRFFRTFLVSGNTNVREMLEKESKDREQGTPGYVIPFHHVMKSMILGESRLYSQIHSGVMNLFDLNSKYTDNHFLHPNILRYLHSKLSYQTRYGRGYVEVNSIRLEADRIGLPLEAVEDSLKRMAYFGLVEFENQSKEGYDSAQSVRITNMGAYYLNELVSKFVYLDLVWMDTPIADPAVVNELLKRVVESQPYKSIWDLDQRFARTRLFLDYLLEMEKRVFQENPELRDSPLTRTEFMPKIFAAFEKERKYIVARREQALRVRRLGSAA